MIRDILKTATKTAISWVGGKLGVPSGITEKVTDVTDSLFTKSGGGGDFKMIDTRVKAPQLSRFGLQTRSPGMSGSAKGYADVVNPETLYAAWDRRLSKYYTDKYKIARTVKGKVV
tara:strand:+ start:324 stop:671 length:348 start_codon:yes stop_codon:yes gene_type:complete